VLTLTFVVGELAPSPVGARLLHEWSDDAGDVYARAYGDSVRSWIDWTGLAIFAFSRGSSAVRAWPAPGASRPAIDETFRRVLQPIILQAVGWQALHASAVVVNDGVVALCGRSGSGKSTIAYALGRRYDQWADDGVIMRRSDDGVVTRRVPFTPRLRPESQVLAGPRRQTVDAGQTIFERPLAAVVVLKQDPALHVNVESRTLPATEAFQALVTHAHCFDADNPEHRKQFADDYLAFAGMLAVSEVTYRPGLANLDAVMAAIVRSVPGSDREDTRSALIGD
jgi:hypothetical protein